MVTVKSIDINQVTVILKNLIEKRMSREKAASWAFELREAADKNCLKYIPIESKELLWQSILFLEGIDLQDSPGCYLHNEDDILIFLHKLKCA